MLIKVDYRDADLHSKCAELLSANVEKYANCIELIKKYYGDNDELILNEYAISDSAGINYLKLDINNKVSGSSQLINAEALCKENNNLIEVKTNTFANFIKDNDIKVIDYLKVDCEGGENFIFNKDNIEFIKNNVKKIAVEKDLEIVNPDQFLEVMLDEGSRIEIVHFIGGG